MLLKSYEEVVIKSAYEVMDELINNGNLYDHNNLNSIVKKTIELLISQKDASVEDIIKMINTRHIEEVKKMVYENKTSGIAASTKIKNGPEINIYDGKTSSLTNSSNIDENTRFDLASCTKLFTAIQFLYYHENLLQTKVNEIDKDFNIDATIKELLTFYHQINTQKRIDDLSLTKKEAIQLLKEAKIVASGIHQYSDIPYMIVRQIMPDFEQNFKTLFNQKMELSKTGYEVDENEVITGGNKNELDKVHDRKARIIPYAGHAGIYSTTKDLIKLFDGLNNLGEYDKLILNRHLVMPSIPSYYLKDEDGKYLLDKNNNPIAITRGMMYRKHPMGLAKTEVLPLEGTEAFSTAGFTGTWANYDLQNNMTANILTNPLSGSDDGKKATGYAWSLDKIKEAQIEAMIQTKIVKKVFDSYYEPSLDFQKSYVIKSLG